MIMFTSFGKELAEEIFYLCLPLLFNAPVTRKEGDGHWNQVGIIDCHDRA